MADFTRTIIPNKASWPKFPTGLDSYGLSGKGQFRSTLQVGRTWEEEYPAIKWNNASHRGFLAYINSLFRERTIFTISHYHLQAPLGTISGNLYFYRPTVEQTGSSIQVSSSTSSQVAFTGTFKQGDIIKIATSNIVYDITADASNATSLSISPPLFTGNNIADDAVITYTAVTFRCVIDELTMPMADKSLVYKGLKIKFRETA